MLRESHRLAQRRPYRHGLSRPAFDAVTLADLLNSRPAPEALRTYNRRRLLRSQALRVASSAMARLALAESAQPLRDGLLRLAGRRGGPGAG